MVDYMKGIYYTKILVKIITPKRRFIVSLNFKIQYDLLHYLFPRAKKTHGVNCEVCSFLFLLLLSMFMFIT